MQSLSYQVVFSGVALITVALGVAYTLSHSSQQMPQVPAHTEPTFLYVQNATAGSLVPNQDGERWTLTLFGVGEQTTFFSDRPAREVGREPTVGFVSTWNQGDNSFAAVPPNAALDIFHADGTQSVLVLELMSVSYNEITNTLTYEVLPLEPIVGDIARYASFAQSALFIDSTYKHYKCDCEPAAEGGDCQCKFDYTLGHGATKEFRVSCSETAQQDIAITHRKKDTTCTIDFSTGGYKTKSCTNWHTSNSDTVTVKAICNDNVD
ncbi:MAG: hypothetical protein AAGA35_00825 [Patescibacteria group bacterium]